MHAAMKMAKIPQNRQIRRADFALTILTKIPQNRQIEEHSLRLTKFRQICHFRHCVYFWAKMCKCSPLYTSLPFPSLFFR